MKYKDLFVDFDDTLYDTHGNAVIALGETFDVFHLERYFADPQVFYDAYWMANIDLWTRYSKGEITRDYLIVERFRRPLSEGQGIDVTKKLCLEMSDCFLDFCASKPGVVEALPIVTASGIQPQWLLARTHADAGLPRHAVRQRPKPGVED